MTTFTDPPVVSGRPPDRPVRTVLGRYQVGEVIGRGGMSTVRRGHDVVSGAPVAIKVLAAHLSHDDAYRRRLLAEARAISRLPHPNIVQLVDWGIAADGTAVLVMELVEGETLHERLARGPLLPAEAAQIARQIAGALGFAHDRGVIHRDVKPHNILLHDSRSPGGNAGVVAKLADFGIARDQDVTTQTATGLVMGSAPYLAPEILRGLPATPQSDLYALGVTLFQMLAGRLPFAAPTAAATLTRRLVEPAPRLRTAISTSPAWLDGIVAALLAGDPLRRPRSASVVAQVLSRGDASAEPLDAPWDAVTRPVALPAYQSLVAGSTGRRATSATSLTLAAWAALTAHLRRVNDLIPEQERVPAIVLLCLGGMFLLVTAGAVAGSARHVTASAAEAPVVAEATEEAAATVTAVDVPSPTAAAAAAEHATAVPPTEVPPTAIPPTAVPPTPAAAPVVAAPARSVSTVRNVAPGPSKGKHGKHD